MIGLLYNSVREYFDFTIAVILFIQNAVIVWLIPYFYISNNHQLIFLAVLIRHALDILISKMNIIPQARMEKIAYKCVYEFFVADIDEYDINFQKLVATDKTVTRHIDRFNNHLQGIAFRITDDLTSLLEIVINVIILSWYLPYTIIILFGVIITIYKTIKNMSDSRFDDETSEINWFFASKFISELYLFQNEIKQFLQKSADNKYQFALKWGIFNYNSMLQRVWIDIAIIIYLMICISYCYASDLSNKTTILIVCTTLLKSINRIRSLSRNYFGLYNDYITLKKTRDDLMVPKIEQITKFTGLNIAEQSINIEKKSMKIENINLPDKGMVLVSGESGHGKTIFLSLLSGFIADTTVKICTSLTDNRFRNSVSSSDNQRPLSCLRELCCFYTKSFDTFKNITVRNFINKCGLNKHSDAELNRFLNIAALPDENLLDRKLNTLSEGQVQRVAVAAVIADAKSKKILIFDEATSALDGTTSKKLIGNIAREFSGTHLVFIVSHSESVHNMSVFNHVLNADNMIISQLR